MNTTRRDAALKYIALARADINAAERSLEHYLKLANEYGCTSSEMEEAAGRVVR